MIRIVCIGKIKESYIKEGISDYLKRISNHSKIEIIELKESMLPQEPSDKEIQTALELEGKDIEKYMNNSYNICMDVKGELFDSVSFSEVVRKAFINYPTITFIIGSSYGIADSIKKKCNLRVSFSAFTLPHQLFRLVLLEQIYRSMKIISNEKYHK